MLYKQDAISFVRYYEDPHLRVGIIIDNYVRSDHKVLRMNLKTTVLYLWYVYPLQSMRCGY